ncbi:MAG TPA: CHASE2 domain-containing protein, partial [Steroidobacteraceae bacterium]
YFEQRTDADANLCTAVKQARAANVPVWAGYTNKNLGAATMAAKTESGVLPCFDTANLGSLLGFADSDGRVRAVWLSWARMQDQPSFSVLGARILEASYGRKLAESDPDEHVLRYLPPPQDIPVYTEADIYDDPGLLENRLVLIGLNVPEDRFHTPFGVQPGTRIQANAIHSLRVDARITRPDGIWSAFVVALLCYLIVVLAIDGLSTKHLLLVVAGMSLAVIAASALLMYAWRMWFEVIYALVAMWLLVPLLPVLRRLPAWRREAGVE